MTKKNDLPDQQAQAEKEPSLMSYCQE